MEAGFQVLTMPNQTSLRWANKKKKCFAIVKGLFLQTSEEELSSYLITFLHSYVFLV